jgi:leucyl-tRNA synthetase
MNEMYKAREVGAGGTPEWKEAIRLYILMLAPVCPHLAEELWQRMGQPYSVHTQSWPQVDEAAAAEQEITLIVQVNGKLRDRITVPASIDDETAKATALASPTVQKMLEGKSPRQVILVPKRLVNIVL